MDEDPHSVNSAAALHVEQYEGFNAASFQLPKRLTSQLHAWLHLIGTVLFTWFSLHVGLLIIADRYTFDSDNTLNSRAVFGTIWYLAGLVVSPLAIGYTTYTIAQHRGLSRPSRVGMLALLGSCCFIIVGLSFGYLIQADITFRQFPHPDNYKQFLGGFLVVIFGILGFGIMHIALQAAREYNNGFAPTAPSTPAKRDIQPYGIKNNWKPVALLFIVLGFSMFLTSFLSPVWNYSATSYFGAPSPYTLVNSIWTIPFNNNDTSIHPDHIWLPPVIVVKLYKDVCVYFGVVLGFAVLGIYSVTHSAARQIIHRRIRMPALLLRAKGMGWFPTVGEVVVVGGFLALLGYWLYFWGFEYARIGQEAALMSDYNANYQKAARVLGHLTTLCMSFMTFPVTRNSVWESAFGIPFDRAIKYHRALGRLAWALVTAHMVTWQIKWAKEGTLWNNVVTIDNLIIANTGNVDGDYLHDDNFTIPIAELGWLILTAALIFANFFRRSHYWLFQYTHYAAWFFFLSALIHAWTHWYYMAGGLALYALDKIVRLVKSSRRVTVLRLSYAAGVTRLELSADFLLAAGGHYAGQYAFLSIPCISNGQSHPFTISSAPQAADSVHGQRAMTFHIKNMGKGTWTGRLAELAMANVKASSLVVSVDGPHGRTGHYFEKQTVLLVAGGIGVTPFHSIITDLLARAREPATYGSLGSIKKVHLVWVTKDSATLQLFADTVADIERTNPNNVFSFQLYCTQTTRKATSTHQGDLQLNDHSVRLLSDAESLVGSADPLPAQVGMCQAANAALVTSKVVYGRPDLDSIFQRFASQEGSVDQSTAVAMVCGPDPLVQQVSHLAFLHNFDFHSEIFNF